ncbi:MAG: hypothetical protein EPN31_13875 [Castellaniella sp.]|uniref:hypothetical protein n=1 Tax=Castellaniella sp. TaxID=1955812 RepID=UPI00121649B8|nr:hypothetical protein [Castellaniella sp.]TAN26008.1 MAG: hypothetical protein EPN31_13875 [Castellaniella sp.]
MQSAVKVQVRHVLNRESGYVWFPGLVADHRYLAPVLSFVLADVVTPGGDTRPNVVLPVTAAGIVTSGIAVPAPFTDGEDLSKHASACRVAAQWGGETQQAGQ